MANKCKECGCSCKKCLLSDHDIQLHVEIENLKQRLLEKENHIVTMETTFLNEANKLPSGEMGALKEELLTWQDKYKRLYEAHRRVQRVNQGLEDKLLKLVDVCETDKNTLTKDVATLSQNLAEANYAIKKLTEDNERYKNDVNLAIQFLQCKQTNFVAHRFDSLPNEVQTQVAAYMTQKRKPIEDKRPSLEPRSIKVPIPTFPPTAMVYSVPKNPQEVETTETDNHPQVDIVSAAIMAKVLEERQRDRALAKHCDSCTCAKNLKIIYDVTHHHVGTQTGNETNNVCLRCNDTSLGVQIVKLDEKKQDIVQQQQQQQQNVVKVQPNNYCLIDLNEVVNNEKPQVHSKGGPRFASLRLQSGSNNILLDNPQHHNTAPVLYTGNLDHPPQRENLQQESSSVSTIGSKRISLVSENSMQHQQRVSDWVQVTVDNERVVTTPDHSTMKEFPRKIDRARYVEMEENVKRFLFGESDFWKTVEIGKLKYKSFQDGRMEEQTTFHTETDI